MFNQGQDISQIEERLLDPRRAEGLVDSQVRTLTLADREDRASQVGVEFFLPFSRREEEELEERKRLKEQASRDQDQQSPGQDKGEDGSGLHSSLEAPKGGEMEANLDCGRREKRQLQDGQELPGAMTSQSRRPHEQELPPSDNFQQGEAPDRGRVRRREGNLIWGQ